MDEETPRTNRRLSAWFRRTSKRFKKPPSDHSQPASSSGKVVATAIAKWLVPSISALFIAVGFAVESAHQDLLGIERAGLGTSDYIAASSSFLRDLLTIVPDLAIGALTWANLSRLDGLQTVLIFILLVVCIGMKMAGTQSFLTGGGARQWGLAFLLILFTFSKCLLLDAPLARISNVLVGVGGGSGETANSLPLESKLVEDVQKGGLNGFIAHRALLVWTHMICSRVSRDALHSDERKSRVECVHDELESKGRINNEFLAHSLLAVLLLILALQGLRRATVPWVAAVALIVAGYTLTWPYAYGKLVKSTYYEYGLVRFKTATAEPGTTPAAGELATHAIVLFRDSSSFQFLVVKDGQRDCARGESSQEVKLWEVSNSEVVAVKEIYREDVIAWKTLHERACPPPRAPI